VIGKFEQQDHLGDFRPLESEDRLTALLAVADARGEVTEKPRCLGYANCCGCPVCLLGPRRKSRPRIPAKEPIAA
jgi:hypothetical protein